MISEKDLKTAAREFETLMLDSLPEPDACVGSFSPRFERRMKKLLLRTDHPFRYWIQKSAACFLLVVLLGGGLLAFSSEARAAFFGWVREVCETYFSYRYVGETQTVPEGVVYCPAWVPEGYEVVSESHGVAGGDMIYQKGDEGIIVFSWSGEIESSVFRVDSETAEVQNTSVENCPADLYLERAEDSPNALVWTDKERKAIFSITAMLTEDEMLKIAESVDTKYLR